MKKKDKQWDAYKVHMRKLSEAFRYTIFAGEYDLKTQYDTDPREEESSDSPCAAQISVDHKYLLATITFYPIVYEWYKEKKFEDIARVILHEICHILTEPLYRFPLKYLNDQAHDDLREIRERQTQRITNTLFQLIKKSDYMPK